MTTHDICKDLNTFTLIVHQNSLKHLIHQEKIAPHRQETEKTDYIEDLIALSDWDHFN